MLAIDRSQKAATFAVQAAVGGLNARDALADMPPQDALTMVNLFPYADRVATRPGTVTLSTASSITIAGTDEGFRRLMKFVGGGTETPFGGFYYLETVGGNAKTRFRIYSIDANGTLTASREVVTVGSTDNLGGIGEWTNFTTISGTSYMLLMATIANAVPVYTNTPQAFDGASWSAPAITGLPEFTLGVHSHRNRLWFYNCDSIGGTPKPLSAYYLPTGAIAGAVTEFNVGPFCKKGGRIVAMRTWMTDGGDGGADDMAVFVTDQGEVLIYQGTDPASSSTWALVGVFDVGKLAAWRDSYITGLGFSLTLRDNFAMKYGNDVLILTQNGLTSLQRVVGGQTNPDDYQISAKIRPLLTDAALTWANASNSTYAGWKVCYLPILQHLFVIVPSGFATSSGKNTWVSTMYVMNTSTGAWTTYDTSMSAIEALVTRNALYFTQGGRTIKSFTGSANDDSGSAITYTCLQAYNYLQNPNEKLATLIQPMLSPLGAYTLQVSVATDFNSASIVGSTSSYTTADKKPLLSPNAYGRAFAAYLTGTVSAGALSWYATNWIYRGAGIL